MKKIYLCLYLMILIVWATDWPMLYYDPAHTSFTNDEGPSQSILSWSYQTGGSIVGSYLHISSPAVVGTRL